MADPTVTVTPSSKVGIDIGELPAHIQKLKKLIDDAIVPLHQLTSTIAVNEGAVGVPESSNKLEGGKGLTSTKTFWGGASAIAGGIFAIFQWYTAGHDMSQLPTLIMGILAAGGGGTAIYGRATATEKVR